MHKAKLFTNGKSQAVRLPKEYRFEGEEVYIKKFDDVVILIPVKNPWSVLIQSLDKFSDDYLNERNQPAIQHRNDT